MRLVLSLFFSISFGKDVNHRWLYNVFAKAEEGVVLKYFSKGLFFCIFLVLALH